ncbi:Auxin-responsive protein IAA12 [Zea mays]|uniref:Auxin-responsive protein n=1 Tax=Zea mays TaxID=4577 RepID=B8A178_MAIZE|eukprot:NP_001303670.1 Auxin-responsive protein IAA4 [Zea mays]
METVVGDLMATELRLGLPGTVDDCSQHQQQTQLKVAAPPSNPTRGKKRPAAEEEEANKRDAEAAPPAAKAPVVGWPPVRSYRKSCFQQAKQQAVSSSSKAADKEDAAAPAPSCTASAAASNATASAGAGSFVKVSMDGAPYLRKLDLRMYKGYRELREALEAMFVSSGSANNNNNLSEFAVTYQDKDGDLMLVGDVPFEMFASTCRKLRIMKRSEATGLGSARQ